MPAKNTEKVYVTNGHYHIFNRGVEKRNIFSDAQDYTVFLSYLKEYLLPKDESTLRHHLADPATSPETKDKILKKLRMNNFAGEVTLLAYALMPNHFHILIRQKESNAIDVFMNSLSTRYSMYFNRRYKRVGPLCQGEYKAVLVTTDEQLLHLSRYIHRNPLSIPGVALQKLVEQPTSYADYLGFRKTSWVKSDKLLAFFSKTNPRLGYEAFVREVEDEVIISDLKIDDKDA